MNDLINSIIKDEGFKGIPYEDSKGYLTIGYGTKLPLTKEEAEMLLKHRLGSSVYKLQLNKPFITKLPNDIQNVLYEMVYQLGVNGLLSFKKMWKAIENRDWNSMIKEMRDSKWYVETPDRVEILINKVRNVRY